MFIKEAKIKIIKDSRKEKTVEVILKNYKGKFVCSSPSGKSKGKNEVDSYNPRGISYSLRLAKHFLQKIENKNFQIKKFQDIENFERLIRNYEKNFGVLGGNVVYAIEGAFLKAAAKENNKELWKFIFDSFNEKNKKINFPMPVGNCIGGGMHSEKLNGRKPDFQEFLLIPNEKTFSKAFTKNFHAYYFAKKLLRRKEKKIIFTRNDENAWRTDLNNEEVLDIMKRVSEKYNLRIGLDLASSSFLNEKGYYLYKNKEMIRDRHDQIDYLTNLIKKYKLYYVEDPLSEEDFAGFKELLDKTDSKTLIVGDDLTTTNLRRLIRAERAVSINALIVKPNQIGSLVEVSKVIQFCKEKNIKIIFSHRSGETMDNILADYAVGFQANFIKTGIEGKERLIKLKRIMEIEKSLEKYKN